MKQSIVFLDRETFRHSIHFRPPNFDHTWTDYDYTPKEKTLERLKDATIAISNKVYLSGDTLAQLPKLKYIAVAATGMNNVDLAWCKENNLPVKNVVGYAAETVPEHVFSMILSLSRNITGWQKSVQAGDWTKSRQFCYFKHDVMDISHKTIALVGTGAIGEGVAKIARGFSMHVLKVERKGAKNIRPGYTPFDEAIKAADIINLNCPLTPETENLIGIKEFQQMSQKPIIINTGRGGLVNEADLVTALRQGLIRGAGFDVLTKEPMDKNHPFHEILDYDNFILTPHIAWSSETAMQRLADQLIDDMENYFLSVA